MSLVRKNFRARSARAVFHVSYLLFVSAKKNYMSVFFVHFVLNPQSRFQIHSSRYFAPLAGAYLGGWRERRAPYPKIWAKAHLGGVFTTNNRKNFRARCARAMVPCHIYYPFIASPQAPGVGRSPHSFCIIQVR